MKVIQHAQPSLAIISPRLFATISNAPNRELYTLPSPRISLQIIGRITKVANPATSSDPPCKLLGIIITPPNPPRGDCTYHRRSQSQSGETEDRWWNGEGSEEEG